MCSYCIPSDGMPSDLLLLLDAEGRELSGVRRRTPIGHCVWIDDVALVGGVRAAVPTRWEEVVDKHHAGIGGIGMPALAVRGDIQ